MLTPGHQKTSTVSASKTHSTRFAQVVQVAKISTTSFCWRGRQMSIWRQWGIGHEAKFLNMPGQTQWTWWLMGQHDSQRFWNSPFFTDSVSFGNLSREKKKFTVGGLHPQKRHSDARIIDKLHIEEREIKYQQMANIRLWFRRGSRESHQLGFLIRADAALGRVNPQGQDHMPHMFSHVSLSWYPPDECWPAQRLHRDPHGHLSLCTPGRRHLRSSPGSKVRPRKLLITCKKLLLLLFK